MGIAWLLLRRTFTSRPKRTLLFILGYALSTAVMITLLSVGEAVLLQAQDKDLLGGGDLILVPQGVDVESLKVGGLSALYYSIPQARFIVRQILGSTRFQNEIDTVCPYLVSKLIYAKTEKTLPVIAFADGSLPEQEMSIKKTGLPWKNNKADQEWLHPDQENFYHEIDRFHLPQASGADLERWAEWHYFNFEANGFHGYLTIMVVGNVLSNSAAWNVTLQIGDARFVQRSPAQSTQLPLQKIDYNAGSNRIKFERDHYEIDLNFQDRGPIHGTLLFYPDSGLYLPPTTLAKSNDFESGYVIPGLRGTYAGAIVVGEQTYSFTNASGYHDHNWGIWQRTEWNWGHAYGKEYSIFFGEIFLKGKSKGLFLGVYDRRGFLAMFRPDQIQFSNYTPGVLPVPQTIEIEQNKQFSSIHIAGKATDFVTTPVDGTQSIYFIQYKMNYDVRLEIDGKESRFAATGNAETYIHQ
jgi:hypothetical protein